MDIVNQVTKNRPRWLFLGRIPRMFAGLGVGVRLCRSGGGGGVVVEGGGGGVFVLVFVSDAPHYGGKNGQNSHENT